MKKSQLQIVSEKLIKDGKISNVWAFNHYILRLGGLIHILRNDGYAIEGGYEVKGKKKTRNYVYTLLSWK